MIGILVPSRQRPDGVRRLIESVGDTARIYLAISREDNLAGYNELSEQVHKCFIMPDNLPTVCKWNFLAQAALQDGCNMVMLGSDDMYFADKDWANTLDTHYTMLEEKKHVYHLQDTRDENGTPHPIATKEYCQAMGYFLPPIFLHWFVDSWTVDIAKSNNCFTYVRDHKLVHDKPSDKGQADETHNRIRHWGWHDRDAIVNNTMQHLLSVEKKRLMA